MAEKNILIICGEASGDLNAAMLVREILKISPELKFSGVGGTLLRQAGVQIYRDIKELAVIGFFDVLKKLPLFFRLKNEILEKIEAKKPDLVILVDFSGFNLRLAKAIKKKIPIIYYTSPQVWASRQGRVKTIKEYITKMIVFFKFEEEFYRNHGVRVACVGHPLLDIVKPTLERSEFFRNTGLEQNKLTIALLPGSRRQEIENIFPVMLKTAELICYKNPDAQFILAKSNQVEEKIYQNLMKNFKINLKTTEGKTYDAIFTADFCLVASGTATLETAILEKPLCVIYKMSFLNYLLYRPQVKIPYIGMVNIVARKKIVEEFIQFDARPQKISDYVLNLLRNPPQLEKLKTDLRQVKLALGTPGAAARAAKIVADFLK